MATKRNDFLSAAKCASRSEVLEFDGIGKVHIRALSAADVRRISEQSLKPGKDPTDGEDAYDDDALTLNLLAASVVDGRGKRVIPEGRESEMLELPNDIYLTLQQAALRVNGMGAQGKD